MCGKKENMQNKKKKAERKSLIKNVMKKDKF